MTSLPFTLRVRLIERATRNFCIKRSAPTASSLSRLISGNCHYNWEGGYRSGGGKYGGFNVMISKRRDYGVVFEGVRRMSGGSVGAKVKEEVECGRCKHVWRGGNGGDLLEAVSCPNCGALQTRKGPGLPNYFDILGHEKSYLVDLQGISKKAKQLQKKFHPDLYSQKGDDQQQLSQEYSSLINKAMSTLTDPISRGRYMLTLSGHLGDDPDADLEKGMTNDPEFLEEVMELNERLEEITSEKNWQEFRNENVDTMKLIHLDLEKAFEENNLKEAQRLLGRMKYFDTLQHKLKELQAKIGIVE